MFGFNKKNNDLMKNAIDEKVDAIAENFKEEIRLMRFIKYQENQILFEIKESAREGVLRCLYDYNRYVAGKYEVKKTINAYCEDRFIVLKNDIELSFLSEDFKMIIFNTIKEIYEKQELKEKMREEILKEEKSKRKNAKSK